MSKLLWMVILMTVLSTYYASALLPIGSKLQDTVIVESNFSGYEYVTPKPEGYNYSRPGYVYTFPSVKLTLPTKPTPGNIYLPPKTTTTTTPPPPPTYLPPYTYLPPPKPPIVYLPVRVPPPKYPPPVYERISTTTEVPRIKPTYIVPAPPPTLPPPRNTSPIIRGYEYLPPLESARLKYSN